MEDFVKDAILMNEFHDLVLLNLVELTVADIRTDRHLFPGLLQEPAFYRKHFQLWVREALEEKEKLLASEQGDAFQ